MTDAHILLITFSLPPETLSRLQNVGFKQVHYCPCPYIGRPSVQPHPGQAWNYDLPPVSDEVWSETTILLTMFHVPSPEQAPNLRYIQVMSAGVDAVIAALMKLKASLDKKLVCANASGVPSTCIAEYVMMQTLVHTHRNHVLTNLQHSRDWNRAAYVPPGTLCGSPELRGKVMGIMGYGSIGREVARLSQSFGMVIHALNRSGEHSEYGGFTVQGTGDPQGLIPSLWFSSSSKSSFTSFLQTVDILVICCPLTAHSMNVINESTLRFLRSSALIINVARGGIIDQEALIATLESQELAGAVLDVTTPEPLPCDHALWQTPNVVITPHIAGSSGDYEERCVDLLMLNTKRLLAGDEQNMLNRVL